MTLRVGIAGAGIGGLTLAHALRRRGIDCVVWDRDARPEHTGGYRLHLTERAFAALAEVAPGAVPALRDCGAGNESFTRFSVLDHRGFTRLRLPMRHDGEVLMIGRRPLRTILARGVDVRWETTVDSLDMDVDLLVAADGTGSRIARQWVGRPTAAPAGVVGIAGRAELPQRVPADLRHGLAFAIGPGGIGAFYSLHARAGRDPAAERPYVVWSLAVPAEALDADADLIAETHRLTPQWSDDFHALVANSDPAGVAAFPFSFPSALQPWPLGRVTLLGDAVHPMPPTAGAGASTAILDAVHLAADLAARPLPDALASYQERMLTYAPAAVDEARPPLVWQRRLANPLLFGVAIHLGLPLAGAVLRSFPRAGER